jgi:hypothetical protein
MPTPAKPIRRTLMHPGPAIAGLAGITIAVSPYVYSLAVQLDALAPSQRTPQPWTLLAGCLALILGGLAMNARRKWDQIIVTLGVALILLSLAPKLAGNPSLALAVLLPAAALVLSKFDPTPSYRPAGDSPESRRAPPRLPQPRRNSPWRFTFEAATRWARLPVSL